MKFTIYDVNAVVRGQINAALAAFGLTKLEVATYFAVGGRPELEGWKLKWSGWRGAPGQGYAGQWAAAKLGEPLIYYASVPGGAGRVAPGSLFDIVLQEGQGQLTQDDLERFALEWAHLKSQALITEALGRLLGVMRG